MVGKSLAKFTLLVGKEKKKICLRKKKHSGSRGETTVVAPAILVSSHPPSQLEKASTAQQKLVLPKAPLPWPIMAKAKVLMVELPEDKPLTKRALATPF